MSDDARDGADTGANVVVTGAAGFIGSHLVEALRRTGRNVVGIDRKAGWPEDEIPASDGVGYLRTIRGDLVSADLDACLKDTSAVFHLAALPGVRPSWTQFPEYLHCNVLATQRLLDACVRVGVSRVVVASSSSVYGGVADGAMSEDDIPHPLSPYGVTKLAAERLALAFAARLDATLSVSALRFFTVYGPGQRPDMFISRVVRATLSGEPIDIYGDGAQIRDFVHVSDVVRALLLAAKAPACGVLNIGTGRAVSVNEVLALTGELTGQVPEARYGPARLGDVRATTADVGRARLRLGFRARTELRAGLATQIEWTRRSLAGAPPRQAASSVGMAPTRRS
ncbi:UDP-glucose 4-epimerase [Streptomyces sp. IMTB 2501]|nr:UDP-glucose 4-epimerase [Streptomyces sp. IMTB 2501]